MAMSIFFYVKSLKPYTNRGLNKLLTANLFIYLITSSIGVIDYKLFATLLDRNILYFVVWVLAVLIGCLIIGHIVILVSSVILRVFSFVGSFTIFEIDKILSKYGRYISNHR